jgi:cytosine/adenosine deaminase-related metal-dependent hydrolase
MILRSRIVLPISQPPIENGAVLISGGCVSGVGHWEQFSSRSEEVVDLGATILLPGLINAHCHLDYTGMAGHIPPQKGFTDWIKLMLATKAEWTYTDFAQSWVQGAQMLLRTGTTTVGDFEAVPELLPDVWTSTPLRIISFLEMTGVKSRRHPRAIVEEAVARIQSLPDGRSRAALAPHAPYSTVPELLRLSAETARERNWPLSIHVAESAQEFEMFAHASGEMYDWLRRNERDMSDCDHSSPVQQLERAGMLGDNLLAIHVNYLGEGDAALLGQRKVNVVHCPRSHLYFQHREFPLDELLKAGVNLCLGTDSLVTVYKKPRETVELSLFDEMQTLAKSHPQLSSKTILQMATVNGARALGLARQAGEISEGALADLIALPFGGKISEAETAVVQHRGNISASMFDGEWQFKA